MAQGGAQRKKAPSPLTAHHHKPAKPTQPKHAGAVKHKILQKRLQGQTIADIERQMAVRAGAVGKLTIMKSTAETVSRKDSDKAKKAATKKKAKARAAAKA